jgi:hypothetical protein
VCGSGCVAVFHMLIRTPLERESSSGSIGAKTGDRLCVSTELRWAADQPRPTCSIINSLFLDPSKRPIVSGLPATQPPRTTHHSKSHDPAVPTPPKPSRHTKYPSRHTLPKHTHTTHTKKKKKKKPKKKKKKKKKKKQACQKLERAICELGVASAQQSQNYAHSDESWAARVRKSAFLGGFYAFFHRKSALFRRFSAFFGVFHMKNT